ncbi:hypothetical protein WJ438_24525 [Streptomyces sp. GD-15H]|uniref:hypothetical protein n=1 Tax=Streptomyces sp. GD-15H TaxID=3129112 RepID=UPI003252D0DB
MMSYPCSRCGTEDKLHRARLCTRCTIADRLDELLDDGTGRIRPELLPLADSLLAMDRPLSGLPWLNRRKGNPGSTADLLRRLGRGDIELTHEALPHFQPWRAAAHLRELLTACGILPAVDKRICSFERWLIGHAADMPDPAHAQVIRRFATWEVLPRLRTRAEKKPITPAARRRVADQVKQATAFLDWLADRDHTLTTCDQTGIDARHAEHNEYARNTIQSFLLWWSANKLTRPFRLPPVQISRATPMPQTERLELIGRLLTAPSLPLRPGLAEAGSGRGEHRPAPCPAAQPRRPPHAGRHHPAEQQPLLRLARRGRRTAARQTVRGVQVFGDGLSAADRGTFAQEV